MFFLFFAVYTTVPCNCSHIYHVLVDNFLLSLGPRISSGELPLRVVVRVLVFRSTPQVGELTSDRALVGTADYVAPEVGEQ
jgi:hypothetical protein